MATVVAVKYTDGVLPQAVLKENTFYSEPRDSKKQEICAVPTQR